MNRFGTCLLMVLAVCCGVIAVGGCAPVCPIDTNGDGVLSQQEIDAYALPTDPAELVNLALVCQGLIPQ